MSGTESSDRLLYSGVIVVALVSVAHAAIFVRMAEADSLVIAAYRMLIAAVILMPFVIYGARDELRGLTRREWVLIALGSVFLALHFATWIEGVALTSIANSVVLVTLTPVWLALWSLVVLRRPPGARLWAAIILAVGGSGVMAWGSMKLGPETLLGDGLALAGGLFFAAFFLVAENVRRRVGVMIFVVLVYAGAAVLLWIPVLGLGLPVAGFSGQTYFALVAIAVVSQVIGHSGFNWAVKAISPMVLALTLLSEPVLSAALGWMYFREGVGTETVIGGMLVLGAIFLGMRATPRSARP